MRIRRIRINHWRNFENLELRLDDTSPIVCLVGANGTGKSHLLELICACANKLGLATGLEIPRGDPFADQHDIELDFVVATGGAQEIDNARGLGPGFDQWDRTLQFTSKRTGNTHIELTHAGGIADVGQQQHVARGITGILRSSQSVYFLYLDADRAYPKKPVHVNELAQAYETDWVGPEYTRGRSFRPSSTLYDEWTKYFLARENQAGSKLLQDSRRAARQDAVPPTFTDHFRGYAESLQQVLPHLAFTGVDSKLRALLFDTTGLQLRFDQLSGGERELAFLIGQIDRFGLRNGLLLVDEPELHLNADLMRKWISYLKGTVLTGQIWLATHSIEAVEATGVHATFVLERSDATRRVNSVARLDARPVYAALSRSVGTPAFSISKHRFVFVEGEAMVGERERFLQLLAAASDSDVRIMECGSCEEVLRRVDAIQRFAAEAETQVTIAGIVDRDFRPESSVEQLNRQRGIFVLPVHEVENFFLHPETLGTLCAQNGITQVSSQILVRGAADVRAGVWIFQHAHSTTQAKDLPQISTQGKALAKRTQWAAFADDRTGAVSRIVDVSGYESEDQRLLQQLLMTSASLYERVRETEDLWRRCEGKQVLAEVARGCGYNSAESLAAAAYVVWTRNPGLVPVELKQLRRFVGSLEHSAATPA